MNAVSDRIDTANAIKVMKIVGWKSVYRVTSAKTHWRRKTTDDDQTDDDYEELIQHSPGHHCLEPIVDRYSALFVPLDAHILQTQVVGVRSPANTYQKHVAHYILLLAGVLRVLDGHHDLVALFGSACDFCAQLELYALLGEDLLHSFANFPVDAHAADRRHELHRRYVGA